jgi:hypothetical protein
MTSRVSTGSPLALAQLYDLPPRGGTPSAARCPPKRPRDSGKDDPTASHWTAAAMGKAERAYYRKIISDTSEIPTSSYCVAILFRCLGEALRLATKLEEMTWLWMTPTLVEICIGLEINGYLPAE